VAGAMRKMAVYLGLVEGDPQDEFDDYEPEPSRQRSSRRGFASQYADEGYESTTVRAIHEPRAVRTVRGQEAPAVERRAPLDFSRIESVHPRSYNDARRIGEDFRDGVPVIMNLGEMDDADAKRVIDFAAGLVFGLRGSIERITNKVFLLSPANVDVGDQARAQVQEDGFFNQS
jgi:cell division inhibitor SepF